MFFGVGGWIRVGNGVFGEVAGVRSGVTGRKRFLGKELSHRLFWGCFVAFTCSESVHGGLLSSLFEDVGDEGWGADDIAGWDLGDAQGVEECLAIELTGDLDGGAVAEVGLDVAVEVGSYAVDVVLNQRIEVGAFGEDGTGIFVGAFEGAFLVGAAGVAVKDANGALGGAERFDFAGGAEFGAAIGEEDGEEGERFDAVGTEAFGKVLVGGGDAV